MSHVHLWYSRQVILPLDVTQPDSDHQLYVIYYKVCACGAVLY